MNPYKVIRITLAVFAAVIVIFILAVAFYLFSGYRPGSIFYCCYGGDGKFVDNGMMFTGNRYVLTLFDETDISRKTAIRRVFDIGELPKEKMDFEIYFYLNRGIDEKEFFNGITLNMKVVETDSGHVRYDYRGRLSEFEINDHTKSTIFVADYVAEKPRGGPVIYVFSMRESFTKVEWSGDERFFTRFIPEKYTLVFELEQYRDYALKPASFDVAIRGGGTDDRGRIRDAFSIYF